MNPLTVRAATPADLPALVELQNVSSPDQPTTLAMQEFRERNRKPDLAFGRVVAEQGGRVVGISTLKEHHLHSVHIPRNATVVVNTNRGNVMVRGSFATLEINNEHGQTEINLNPELIRVLSTETNNGQIHFDNKVLKSHYSMIGTGQLVYRVTSDDGLILVSTSE